MAWDSRKLVTYPREASEFHLIFRRELTVHGRKRWLFLGKLGVEIANVTGSFLREESQKSPLERDGTSTYNLREVWRGYTFIKDIIPTDVLEEGVSFDVESIIGTGSKATSWISRKKLICKSATISSKQEFMQTFCKIETASFGIVIGYSGSSSKIASKISSSSSPLNGDWPSNIS